MTVQTTALRGDYTGNGVTVAFAVPFYFLENSHVQIEKLDTLTNVTTTLALTTDYTLAGAGVLTGGTATLLVAPLATDKIAITRNVPYTQQTHYVEGDPFPSQSHEAALDKLTMLAQQLDEESSRSLKVPSSAAGFDGEIPAMLPSRLVATNPAGTGFELVAPSSGSAAELAVDLADNAFPDRGIGLVGFDTDLVYPAWSAGPYLRSSFELIGNLAASSGSSLVGFLQSGTGAVARTVQDKGRDVITSADFPTLQQCVNAAYGRKLIIKSGTHAITSQLTVGDSINIEMEPGAVIDFSGCAAGVALSEKRAISIEGTLGADVPLTANVTVGAATVTVAAASSADFVAGSYVEIVSTELYMSGAAVGSPTRGHMTRVKSVDTGTGIITLTDRSPFSYSTASSASIRLLTMVDGVRITGGRILGGGTGLVHNGIYAYCAANLVVDGVEIDGCEDTGVSTKHCWAPRIDRCVISNCTSPDPGVGNTGYGVAFYDGTRGGGVHQNSIRNCRHSVSGGNSPCVLYADVSDNHISGCGIGVAALDCHEPCFFWTIRGNTVIGGAEGIGIRGQKAIVSGNIVQGVDGVGIHVKTYTNNTEGINGTVISNNEIYNTGLNGVLLEGRNTNERIHKSIISGNRIDSCGLSGITGLYVNGVEIVGNEISNILTSTGSDGNGIRMVGAALGDVADVSISANNVSNTLRHGIFIQYGMGVSMGQNNISGITTNGVNCQLSDGVSIVGGRIDVSSSTSAAIAIDRTDRVSITAAYILGNAAAASQDGIVVTASAGSSDAIICNGVIVNAVGRYGFYSTNSDRVIVTGCDMRGAVNGTKINIVGATTSVNTDNVV